MVRQIDQTRYMIYAVALICFLIIFGGLFFLGQRGEQIIRQQYSELATANQLIERMAYLDSLTQLPNRNSFEDSIKRQIAHSKCKGGGFALFYMDLDGFKQINDRYGHAVGDLVLRETTHRLRTHIRESDLVFRIGGDEFTALFQDVSSEEIVAGIAGKIIAAVSEPICHQELTLNVTISLGIALCPLHATDMDRLIELSDRAMYQAKRAGSNCFRIGKPETT